MLEGIATTAKVAVDEIAIIDFASKVA